jgi:hypothetical protein
VTSQFLSHYVTFNEYQESHHNASTKSPIVTKTALGHLHLKSKSGDISNHHHKRIESEKLNHSRD